MIGRIGNLAIWEWFKLRRRWMLWILLIFAILFAQLAVWGSFFSYQNLQSTGGEITVPATLQAQQGRAPRTVSCNDLLSGDPARQPTDLDAQVLDGLRALRCDADPSLAFRFSCINANACKECMMLIDGKVDRGESAAPAETEKPASSSKKGEVIDLLTALQRSVDRARGSSEPSADDGDSTAAKSTARQGAAKKAPAKKAPGKKAAAKKVPAKKTAAKKAAAKSA